ncbi:hypothetical protein [uncultured Virgibacillus sp.]|nr:hypothetical protein [uncultured Virgibacillus sp.]
MFVPQGYDLKDFEPFRHLLAVDPPLTNIGFIFYLKSAPHCQLYV